MSLKLDYKAFKKYRLTVFTVFVFCMMASFGFFAMHGMQKTSAASTAGFSAGNIISDAVMSNYNSMTVGDIRSEEHTSELQSRREIAFAVII